MAPCLPSTAGGPAVPGRPPSGCIGYAIRCTRAGIVVIECPRASRSAGRWIDRCVCNERSADEPWCVVYLSFMAVLELLA
jgi:hypothetical protein